ncbi:MAG: hypothetical protein DSY80_05445 [Desulfocapsa sp.]|nr:MAG: hypothetical protein DSY80_05445 [Desulfocapsa sp.]
MLYKENNIPEDSFIDLMSNTAFTNEQIDKRIKSIEARIYPASIELNLNRIATGAASGTYTPTDEEAAAVAEFSTFLQEMSAYKQTVAADNSLLIETIDYEKATARLSQYILSEGKPAWTEHVFKGWKFDADGNKLPICETVTHDAIEPLPPTVPGYDDEGNEIQVPNPKIVKDEEEREAAQVVVDNTSVAAKSLADDRKPEVVPNPCEPD